MAIIHFFWVMLDCPWWTGFVVWEWLLNLSLHQDDWMSAVTRNTFNWLRLIHQLSSFLDQLYLLWLLRHWWHWNWTTLMQQALYRVPVHTIRKHPLVGNTVTKLLIGARGYDHTLIESSTLVSSTFLSTIQSPADHIDRPFVLWI